MKPLLVALALLAIVPEPARAADDDAGDARTVPLRVSVERDRHGRPVIRIRDPFVVRARARLPQAVYVLRRTDRLWDVTTLDADLLSRIHDATTRSPF